MKKIKVGIDVHGVIDQNPDFFAKLCKTLIAEGHEVHIVTGREICKELIQPLKEFGITFTKIFSITTYHKQIGTYIKYKDGDLTQPLIAPPKWDRTKADYCKREGIDIHIDDLVVYGNYFEDIDTQFVLYTPAMRTFLSTLLTVK